MFLQQVSLSLAKQRPRKIRAEETATSDATGFPLRASPDLCMQLKCAHCAIMGSKASRPAGSSPECTTIREDYDPHATTIEQVVRMLQANDPRLESISVQHFAPVDIRHVVQRVFVVLP